MLRRCYDAKLQVRFPSYVGCSVHDDWHSYSAFKLWFDKSYVDGYHLDKDILFPGNMVYSEKTCLFVPQWLNSFVTESTASRGQYMIGVFLKKQTRKFASSCSNPLTKKAEHIGYFDSEQEAHNKWKERKLQHVENLRVDLDLIDPRLYPALKQKYT